VRRQGRRVVTPPALNWDLLRDGEATDFILAHGTDCVVSRFHSTVVVGLRATAGYWERRGGRTRPHLEGDRMRVVIDQPW
jgi:hypothetical protein